MELTNNMEQFHEYTVSMGVPSQTWRTAIHEAIEIKCFYEGTATLLIDSNTISVKAGDVVVINPYSFHKTVEFGENTGKYHLFTVPLDYFAGVPELDLHKLYYLERKMFQTHLKDEPQLFDLLMRITEEYQQRRPDCELMCKLLTMEFFVLLLRKGTLDATSPTPGKNVQRQFSVIEPALKCIKNDYAGGITVEHLAALCNVSKHYFCRTFKSVMNKSAMEYLRDFRLQIANALVTNTNRSIAEISASCGFETPNYFSRCYKQYYGHSPRQSRLPKEEQR